MNVLNIVQSSVISGLIKKVIGEAAKGGWMLITILRCHGVEMIELKLPYPIKPQAL